MDRVSLVTSRWGVILATILGRLMPLRSGLALADRLAERFASQTESDDVQAVRFNHQTLEGGRLSPDELAARVRAVFHNSARGVAEVLYFQHRPAEMLRWVEADDAMQGYIRLTREKNQPIVFTCPHVGNYDLAGRALGLLGLQAMIMAEPTPRADYNYQNRLRRQTGLDIRTISMESLRDAARLLEAGGSVLTGVDWPVGERRFRPRFCGRPSLLPTAHIRLAVNAGVPVVVVACHRKSNGTYYLSSSEAIPMQKGSSLADTIISNTETVLEVVEQFIRQDPAQWLLYRPVWENHEPN